MLSLLPIKKKKIGVFNLLIELGEFLMHIATSSVAVTYSLEEINRVWGSQSMSTSLDSALPGQ